MSRRRVGGGGAGGPAVSAGVQWRQQQEQAALTVALQRLPPRGALPAKLQAGLKRTLLCVRHILVGLDSAAAATAAAAAASDGAFIAGRDLLPGLDVADDGAEEAVVGLRKACVEETAAAAAAAQLRALAAQACARLPRAAPPKGQAAAAFQIDAASSAPWEGSTYVSALLHHYLFLSTCLLENCARRDASYYARLGSRPAGRQMLVMNRDALAAAAGGQAAAAAALLPLGVYGRVTVALGWERHLLDLLAWMPDGEVAAGAAAQVLAAAPGLVPGMAAALLEAVEAAAGDRAEVVLLAAPPASVRRLTGSPAVLQQLAGAVRAAAAEAGGSAEAAAAVAGQWLPALVLLAAELQQALAERPAADAVALTEAMGRGETSWAAEACVALQEALCAWQDGLLAAAAGADPVGPDPVGAGAAQRLLLLLPLLRDGLMPLLDEQARQHIAAQMQVQQQQHQEQHPHPNRKQEQRLVLPYAMVIQLRSRISLFAMAAAAVAAEALAPTGRGGAAQAGGRSQAQLLLTEEDVWCRLAVSSRGVQPGASGPDGSWRSRGSGAAAAAPREEFAPQWLFLATAWEAATSASASARDQGSKVGAVSAQLPAALVSAARAARQHPCRGHTGSCTRAAAVADSHSSSTWPAAVVERVAAVAVALLTPGMASWLVAVREPRVLAAAGPDPFSPFRLSLALLELLQGGMVEPAAAPAAAIRAATAQLGSEGVSRLGGADGGGWRRLELQVLRLAAESMAGVETAEQQAALQAVAVAGSAFAELQRRLAADGALQAAAGRGLVALSNRTAAVRGSLEATGRALSAAAEAQHLAAAAREMLPYAVLAPATCVRRLVLDGLLHPGQQPWVLQLLRSLAATATAAAPDTDPATAVASAGAAAAVRGVVAAPGGGSVLMASLRGVLQDAPKLLRTGADRRSLLALVEGLARAGVTAPRQVLSLLVTPLLHDAAESDGGEGADGEQLQLLAVLQLAQHLLGLPGSPLTAPAASVSVAASAATAAGSGGGGGASASTAALAPAWSPLAELAAAQPAALLLAASAVLRKQYHRFDACGAVHTAVLEATGSVLERAVELYGAHVRAVLYGVGGGGGRLGTWQLPPAVRQQAGVLRELEALAQGMEEMPLRVMSVLVPVLEAASPQAHDGADDDEEDGAADLGVGSGNVGSSAAPEPEVNASGAPEVQLEAVVGALRAQVRALVARVAAPAAWRPRALRSATSTAAQSLLLPVLAFAAASPAHTAALRSALLEVAVDTDAAENGYAAAGTAQAAATHEPNAAGSWVAWTMSVAPTPAATSPAIGALARHVAATAARGVPQLPDASLRAGLAAALAALLPTATADQARRLLIALAPAALLQLQAGGRAGLAAMLSQAVAQSPEHSDAGDNEAAPEVLVAVQAAAASALAPAASALSCPSAEGLLPAVAASLVLACTAATDMLKRAASGDRGDLSHHAHATEAGTTAPAAVGVAFVRDEAAAGALAAAADRCAAHLALLTARLVAMPPSTPALAPVAVLFFVHLCQVVRAVAAATAAAAADQPSAGGRWLDVWQAALLSVLQQLVASLASDDAVASDADARGAGVLSAVPAGMLLTGARAAATQLPNPVGRVLLAALEHMYEERGGASHS